MRKKKTISGWCCSLYTLNICLLWAECLEIIRPCINPIWVLHGSFLILTLYVPGGGQICPPLRKLQISLTFRFTNPYWDLLTFRVCPLRSIYKKTRASYVPRLNFGGPFFDKKFGFQIANVQKILIFAKNNDFSKKSQGYSFEGRGLCW